MSYLVPVVETFFRPTNPVTFLRGKSVYVYFRGTTEEVPLYTSSSGSTSISQPLSTDSSGMPKGAGGVVPWAPPVAIDFKVNGETLSRDLAGAAQQLLDAREWIGYTSSTSDRYAQFQKCLDAARDNGGAAIQMPPWKVKTSQPWIIDNNVELRGQVGASRIEVGAGSNCGALRSARYGLGDAGNGGTERTTISGLIFDGNFAQNSGSTEPVVALDGIVPCMEWVEVKNGYINLQTTMSQSEKASTRSEDGYYNHVWLFDSKEFNWLFEGTHDSQQQNIWAKSNEGINISVRKQSFWSHSHVYGNSKYGWEILSGSSFADCVSEGSKEGHVILKADGIRWSGGRIFYGGGSDGRIGIVFGDAEHSANTALLTDLKIENCTNGAFKFARSGANSLISGLISAESGNIATELTNASPKLNIDGLRVTGGCVNNLATRAKSSQAEVEPPFSPEVELTGTSEVTALKPSYAGHILTLRLTSTAKVKDNGTTLNLAGDFTGPGMLTLRCDGTNFREMARAAI